MKVGGLYDVEIKKKVASSTLKDVPDANLQAVVAEIIAGTTTPAATIDTPASTTDPVKP